MNWIQTLLGCRSVSLVTLHQSSVTLWNLSLKSGIFPAQLKEARVLPLFKKPIWTLTKPALTEPYRTCPTNLNSSSVGDSLPIVTLTTCCLSISLDTGLSIPQKQLCFLSTTTLSTQRTTARYHFSFWWTSARLLTLWTTRYFCQCYPTVFPWTLQQLL